MSGLKFGVNLRFRNPEPWVRPWPTVYDEHLEMARRAEELGFDGVFVPEHHSLPDGYTPAPFVILSAIAAQTSRVRVGTQPLLLPLHHPVQVADDTCSLDVLSGGRAVLGLGAGYRLGDFEAFGRRLEDRGVLMDEACDILFRCFTEEAPFSYSGRFYDVRGVNVSPRSVQRPHPPIVMSVRSTSAARRAGRHGFSANMLPAQGDLERVYSAYRGALEENGWPASQRDITVLLDGFIDRDAERADRVAAPYLEWFVRQDDAFKNERGRLDAGDRKIIAARGSRRPAWTPDDWKRVIEEQDQLFADGDVKLGWVNISVWPSGMPFDQGAEALELFARGVMPHFREGAISF